MLITFISRYSLKRFLLPLPPFIYRYIEILYQCIARYNCLSFLYIYISYLVRRILSSHLLCLLPCLPMLWIFLLCGTTGFWYIPDISRFSNDLLFVGGLLFYFFLMFQWEMLYETKSCILVLQRDQFPILNFFGFIGLFSSVAISNSNPLPQGVLYLPPDHIYESLVQFDRPCFQSIYIDVFCAATQRNTFRVCQCHFQQ